MNEAKRVFNYSLRPIVILLFFQCTSSEQQGREGQDQKKNLLFIMTDQQRYDALSIAGNTVLQTPNLDRLGKEGAYFKNAYTPCAVCTPARSSILTGHTVENTGMNSNKKAYYYEEEGLMTMPTFDEVLAENGYHCEYYGKWHSQISNTSLYRNPKQASKEGHSVFAHGGQRYVHWDYLDEHVPMRETKPGELYDTMTKRPYRTDPIDKHYGMTAVELKASKEKFSQSVMHGKLEIPKQHTLTAFQAKETIEAIERLKDKPFSITCSFHFPHPPILPPEPYYSMYPAEDMVPPVSITDDMANSPYLKASERLERTEYADPEKIKYMISNYYGLVREIDDWVGKILNKLDELGISENTMVIFTSDHGEMLGDHGMMGKFIFYEESAHIPLLIRMPGKITPETTVDGYVSLVDLFPTILDYLNIKKHPSDGKSLRGLMEGSDKEHGKYVVTEWNTKGDVKPNYMILKDGWKLMIPFTKTSTVLNAMYNLNEDPNEMNNLIGNNPKKDDYAEKAEELRAILLEWLKKNNSKHYQGVKERELI
jgi:arylsulfatase A-like enzyme